MIMNEDGYFQKGMKSGVISSVIDSCLIQTLDND